MTFAQVLILFITISSSTKNGVLGSCLEEGVDIAGFNAFQRENVFLEDCQKVCANDHRCTHFTYVKSAKKCWLKNGKAKIVTGRADLISGEKSCGKYIHNT